MKNVSLTCLIVGALALPLTALADDDGAGPNDGKMNTTNPNIGSAKSTRPDQPAVGGSVMRDSAAPRVNDTRGSSTAAGRGASTGNAKDSLDNKPTPPKENQGERSNAERTN